WTGGIVAIDAVETPARFQAPGLDRNQVGAVGRVVFRAFNRYELLLGALSLATLSGSSQRRKTAVAAMTAAAVVQYLWVRPRMQELGAQLDFEANERTDPGYAAVHRLHNIYVALDAVKLALGLVTVLSRTETIRGGESARDGW
ncbi:MAG: DUF4149 domain-containing protein, partial [Actinomycetota bacterium]|nr:DUF4149 domain-containing protein [Actinomycetota bacterium]